MKKVAMGKTLILLSAALFWAAVPARMPAQTFDSSGTGGLNGQYLFRYVNYFNDQYGNLTEACTLSGVITFDGNGKYSTANAQLADSLSPGGCASLGGGTYGVQPNGIAQLDSPLYAATLFGTFSSPVLIASGTEDDYFDLFVAVKAPPSSLSSSSLSGAFTVGTLDFPTASVSLAREGYFTLNADGKGNVAAFTMNGSAANLTPAITTQSVAASTYSLSGTGGGTLNLPGTYGDTTQLIAGAKLLYVSADGNYVIGGSAEGSDIMFGFRAPSGTVSNSLLNGTYFMAGMEENSTSYVPLDAFYGSINTNGNGQLIWHERFDDVVDLQTYDYTFNTPITLGADGSYFDGSYYNYLAGAGGSAMMLIGADPQYSINVGVHAPSVTPSSSVWILPTYITNAANYTPITNAYTPGELVSLYGTFGASSATANVLPIPTNLNGVEVTVNGTKAPVFLTSANQISALIPYEIAGDAFATFQVSVNGTKSNTDTVYVDNSSPGIYTQSETGLGSAAILHADYTLVDSNSPAQPGETVLLFMNGLGTVSPLVNDGAAASSTDLSYADEYDNGGLYVYLSDGVNSPASATVDFAGLAPGFAGLYQVNLTLPSSGLANGDVDLVFDTIEAQNAMATIPVSGFPTAAIRTRAAHRAFRPRIRPTSPQNTNSANRRRALPERIAQKP